MDKKRESELRAELVEIKKRMDVLSSQRRLVKTLITREFLKLEGDSI